MQEFPVVSVILAITSLIVTFYLAWNVRRYDSTKLLIDLMKEWFKATQEPTFAPVRELLPYLSRADCTGIIGRTHPLTLNLPESALEFLREIVKGDLQTSKDGQGVILATRSQVVALRNAPFQAANAVEIVSTPYRLGHVSRKDFRDEFAYAMFTKGSFPYETFMKAAETYTSALALWSEIKNKHGRTT